MSLQRMCSVHLMPAEHIACITRERDKGATAAPLSIPAAPRGNRCCALRSPPAQLTDGRLDSTSRLVSPLAAIPGVQSLSSGLRFAGFTSGRPPWRPVLVIRSPVRRFQRGLNTSLRDRTPQQQRNRCGLGIKARCWVRLKIAEAFTSGRGSPHGCGLRACLTGMLPHARPGSRKG